MDIVQDKKSSDSEKGGGNSLGSTGIVSFVFSIDRF